MTDTSLSRAETYADKLRRAGGTDVSVVRYRTPLDNYEPTPRATAWGHGVRYTNAVGDPSLTLWRKDFCEVGSRAGSDLHHAIFLIDDGCTVIPHYVAGYRPTDEPDAIFLSPFPTNFNADGSPRMRGDDPSRQVDMSGWVLGPHKAYHLKITTVDV